MKLFLNAHHELLSILIQHNVDFIVIGGYAVIFHGYNRTTGDVDIWLKPENENKMKLIRALDEFGIAQDSLKELNKLDFHNHLAFNIGTEPDKIDFLTYIDGVEFEMATREKIIADINHLPIPFLHLNHLILSKMNTGRLQDKADIEELQKVHKYK